MFAIRHKLLIGVLSLAGVLALLVAIGAWGISQSPKTSPQQTSRTYNSYSAYAPAPTATPLPPTPTPPPPTATPATDGADPTTLEQQIAQVVLQTINNDRTSAGVPALQWSSALAGGAYKHSQLMAADDNMAHQLPGEPALGTRINQDGIQWSWCGENIGYTTNPSVDGAMWLHGVMMGEQPPDDPHRENILSPNFTMVGVGIVIDSGNLWLTEDFAAG